MPKKGKKKSERHWKTIRKEKNRLARTELNDSQTPVKENNAEQQGTQQRSRILFNGDYLALLVGVPNTYIGDEIMMAAINLMKINDISDRFQIGTLSPASIQVELTKPTIHHHLLISTLKPAINFHYIPYHWMTSYFNPQTKKLSVYDSLSSEQHRNNVLSQLQLLYGKQLTDTVEYPAVTQQLNDSTCGIFSIAYAFSLFLDILPETQRFIPDTMRQHLQYILKHKVIQMFPIYSSQKPGDRNDLPTDISTPVKQICDKDKHLTVTSKHKYRNDPVKKHLENERRNISRSEKRKTDEFNKQENFKRNISRRIHRNDDDYRNNENQKRNSTRGKKRKIDGYKKDENQQRNSTRGKKRKIDDYKKDENQKRNSTRGKKRKIDSYRKDENQKHNSTRGKKRKIDSYKKDENQKRNSTRGKKRKIDSYKKDENQKRNSTRGKKRKIDSYKKDENQKRNVTREKKRKIDSYRKDENQKHNSTRGKKRKIDDYKKDENQKRNVTREKKRKIDSYRKDENQKRNSTRGKKRKIDDYKKDENQKRNVTREKKRKIDNYRRTENLKLKKVRSLKRSVKKTVNSLQGKTQQFFDMLKRGDTFICTCCNQTFFQHSVNLVVHKNLENKIPPLLLSKCLSGLKSCCNAEWICKTCYKYLIEHNLPPMATANGFKFRCQPPVISASQPTATEERCTALRIPFMQIKQLGVGKQYGIFGTTVNVPMNPVSVIESLPRKFENTSTIHLQFKRRSEFKSSYIYETVRPKVIYDLTKYFVENSDLYKEEGVTIDNNWMNDIGDSDEVDYRINEQEEEDQSEVIDDDNWNEVGDEDLYATGNRDTLLQNIDFTDDGKHAIQIAPGEKNHPLSLYMDTYAEEKAFPVLFAGQKRAKNDVPVKYSTICKAELRNSDRRFANSTANIFFKLKKLQTLQVRDITMTALRKTVGNNLTAGQLKQQGGIDSILRLDEGFNILKTLRSSPPYFQSKQKELFAMINQIGLPTFFLTLSAAETKWNDLLLQLAIKQNKDATIDTVQNMTWIQKSELIQKDPVTCARYFHYRSDLFLNKILLTPESPIGQVLDYFIRVEFQHRGSPHLHTLFWIKDAPVYGSSLEHEIIKFIDSIISCSSLASSEQLQPLLRLQHHSHTKSCRKKNKKECRFGFPLPPMESTSILEPLPTDMSKEELRTHKKNYAHVQDILATLTTEQSITHKEFLDRCKLTNEQYLLALRYSLDKTKVFMKRTVADIRTNNYNASILQIWQANTDIQYILDPWSVCAYIAGYMMKSQRGMGLLLQEACREANAGNHSIRRKLQIISNKFLNHSEISAQEAVYLLLQMPLTQSSRQVLFVNTSPPEQRIHILKPTEILKTLPDDSTEVTCTSLIQRYADRPDTLKKMTLAEFAAWFDRSYKKKKTTKEDEDIIDTTDNVVDDIPTGIEIQLQDGQRIIKRTRPKILRYVKYSVQKDPENYYREQILLFYPWTDELNLLGNCNSYKSRYDQLKEPIERVKKDFDKYGDTISKTYEDFQEQQLCDAMDTVAPNSRQSEEEAAALETDSTEMQVLQPQTSAQMNYDLALDMGLTPAFESDQSLVKNRITNEDFYSLLRSMNKEQRFFFDHILHTVKTKESPFHIFLSGGAGVGKSHVLKAVYQGCLRFYDTQPGQNPDDIQVVIGATTGKAAFNVNGNTLHSLFHIPANHTLSMYKTLDHSTLNTLRCQFSALKILIIDEISMMGCNFFNFLNNRLKDIFGTEKHFGGISLLLVGDLFQLRPVMDKWIFQNIEAGYGPLAPNIWQDLIYLYELQTVMRQKDDASFAHVLNRIREGKHNETDTNTLLPRASCHPDANQKENIIHLFATNQQVDSHNICCLENIDRPGCTSYATDYTIGDVSSSIKSKVLDIAKDLPPQRTQNLTQSFQIKISGKYMITHNIDTTDGLTNGATCVIKNFKLINGKPTIVWVQFEDQHIGAALRQKMRSAFTPEINRNWVPIQQIDRQFQVGKYKTILVIRKQFPLKPASAITIHKSQGISLQHAIISLKGRIPPHMVYVALSRVTKISGLFLTDFDKSKIKVDQLVQQEMQRLRTTRTLSLHPILPDVGTDLLVICHNTRSLHAHIADVSADYYNSTAHILILQETWELEKDGDSLYTIPGFNHFHKVCSGNSDTRPHRGTRIYLKPFIKVISSQAVFQANFESIALRILDKLDRQIMIISIYKHPKANPKQILHHMSSVLNSNDSFDLIIVLGDFNIDLKKSSSFTKEMLSKFDLKQLLNEETTDYHSQLDHIYTRQHNLPCGVSECYWSDHKRIWLCT